jgi:hypothetical protein
MGNGKKPVRRGFCKFYTAKPRENVNVDELANDLIALKNVDEVYITDRIDDSGILVKTRFGEELGNLKSILSKHLGKSYGEVHAIAYKRTR